MADYYSLIEKKDHPASYLASMVVANVELNGLLEKEVIIEIDKQKVGRIRLEYLPTRPGIGSGDNFTMAGGHVFESDKKFLGSI